MKKLLFALLFISTFASAQISITNPFSVALVAPPSSGFEIDINLTDASHHSGLSHWNEYDQGMTPAFLIDNTGTTTGIKLVVGAGTINTDVTPGTTAAPNFPIQISQSEWYSGPAPDITFTFTGVPAGTYTIYTVHYDTGVGNPTTMQWNGGTVQSANPPGSPVQLTFTGLTPVSGSITGIWSGETANPIINGIILIKTS